MEAKEAMQNGGIYTQFLMILITMLSVVVFVFLSSGKACADTIDYTNSSVNYGSISNFAAGLAGDMKDTLVNTIHEVNIANNKKDQKGRIVDSLQILHAGFSGYYSESDLGTAGLSVLAQDDDSNVAPEVIGEALVYPNPFRIQSGVAKLGYRLSKDMDVQIQIYDMMANMILKRTFYSGAAGAQKGYNKLKIDNDVFEGEPLSSGVYFYLIIHEGKVLAKGKMAVKP